MQFLKNYMLQNQYCPDADFSNVNITGVHSDEIYMYNTYICIPKHAFDFVIKIYLS